VVQQFTSKLSFKEVEEQEQERMDSLRGLVVSKKKHKNFFFKPSQPEMLFRVEHTNTTEFDKAYSVSPKDKAEVTG